MTQNLSPNLILKEAIRIFVNEWKGEAEFVDVFAQAGGEFHQLHLPISLERESDLELSIAEFADKYLIEDMRDIASKVPLKIQCYRLTLPDFMFSFLEIYKGISMRLLGDRFILDNTIRMRIDILYKETI